MAPNTQTPNTQTPNTQTPNTQTPNTQTPNTQTPNTQTHKAEEVWRTVQEARLRPAYALRCRMHLGVEVTESSTNKQHHLSRKA